MFLNVQVFENHPKGNKTGCQTSKLKCLGKELHTGGFALKIISNNGKVFQSSFNYDWKTVAETKKNKFLNDFRFIWHPTWPQDHNTNEMK